MAEGLNRVVLIGNLARDPETRGSALKLSVACGERYKDQSGEWKDRTEFVAVTVFGKRGEALGKILSKGSGVAVEGSLRTSSYEKNGEKRYSTEVIASNVLLTGGKREAGEIRERAAKEPATDAFASDDSFPF